jgi:hypothetical protein
VRSREEEQAYRRADFVRFGAGGDRDAGGGGHPADRDFSAEFYRWKKLYGGPGTGSCGVLK